MSIVCDCDLPVLQNCKLLHQVMQPVTNGKLFPAVLQLYKHVQVKCTIYHIITLH